MSGAMLLAGLCTSCQQDSGSLDVKNESVNEVIVRATIASNNTKVSFKEDGTENKLKASWENDDHIVGWDAEGNPIELEIASIEDNGTAVFKTVEGSSRIPDDGKVYMIYAPGKDCLDIESQSLEYNLSEQESNDVPALMIATGEVTDGVLELTFINQLAIVAVKNPKFEAEAGTKITGLKLSGDNILTKATFSVEYDELKMVSSEENDISTTCDFTTGTEGVTTETIVYFAVLPNSTTANVTISTTSPEGYQISFQDKYFAPGKCYLLNEKEIDKQTFTITIQDGIENGTITADQSSKWGETVNVTATPVADYHLASLTYNDGTTNNVIDTTAKSFEMPKADVTISGSFSKDTYTCSKATCSNGSFTLSPDTTKVEWGTEVTVTPSAATGYELDAITYQPTGEDATAITSDKKFTMPKKDVTVAVTFKKTDYTIAKNNATHGSFTVKKGNSEVTTANYQDMIVVVPVPADGYIVNKISYTPEGGEETEITSNQNFEMPASAVTVTVTFKPEIPGTLPEYTIETW